MATPDISPLTRREQYLAERKADSIARRTSTCGHCRQEFVAGALDRLAYCSSRCAALGRDRRQHWPSSKVWCGACVECGKHFVSRRKRQCCSAGCEAIKARTNSKAYAEANRSPVRFTCPECGSETEPEYGAKRRVYCSDLCGKRAARRVTRKKERARLRLAVSESVNPTRVFERDGWRCQCCRKATPRERRGTYHPRAPELDHIVPLSKGGDHTYRNTQLLCRACNAAKSDNDEGQQMRLFG